MDKVTARLAVERKFTNLLDGKVMPNVCVATIIDHYEALLQEKSLVYVSHGNIEESFREDDIRHMTEEEYRSLTEADFWDGDGTDMIQY